MSEREFQFMNVAEACEDFAKAYRNANRSETVLKSYLFRLEQLAQSLTFEICLEDSAKC